jgi:hypothetical protein
MDYTLYFQAIIFLFGSIIALLLVIIFIKGWESLGN